MTSVAVTLLTVITTGCSTADPPQGVPPPVVAPEAFTEREPLASCGEVVLDQGETVPDSAWSCLDRSRDTGAELKVTMPTIEGDPIVTYYRVGPGIDGVELFVDNRADEFTAAEYRGWSHQVCPDTVAAATRQGCTDA